VVWCGVCVGRSVKGEVGWVGGGDGTTGRAKVATYIDQVGGEVTASVLV
jgi:hypothetical protein